MGFFLNKSLMFGVPDQEGRIYPDFLKEFLCPQGGDQPVKTDLGEFLSLQVALDFDPLLPVRSNGPKNDGIFTEHPF